MVEKAKGAKEVGGRTEAPKLGVNQTNQEWERWKSCWAKCKLGTGLTDQWDSVYSLWGCSIRKLKMLAFDDKLEEDANLGEDEEQFLKRVRKLAVRLTGYYTKEVFVQATHEMVPQPVLQASL